LLSKKYAQSKESCVDDKPLELQQVRVSVQLSEYEIILQHFHTHCMESKHPAFFCMACLPSLRIKKAENKGILSAKDMAFLLL
jgi:hypothetical protein